jgi:hypothetical protein
MVNHWNWLLAKARGRYVKFVFGDDVLVSKGTLGLMVAALDSRQDVGLVFSERLLINSSSESTGLAETFKRRGLYTGKDLIFECLSQQKNLIGEPTAVMFRSEIASRGFDPRYSQLVDLEMWAFLTLEATAIFIDEPLVAFRLHENQQTNVNLKISGLSEREMLSLFFCYWREGGYRHARIIVAYKRALRKSDSETQALCDRLTHAAKPHFLFLCYVASLDRALRRPFQNLARFVRRFFSKTSLLKR